MKKFVLPLAMLASLLLLACAPAVQSHKDENYAFATGYYRVLIQEGRHDAEYIRGMDTVAARIFGEAGLSMSTYYNKRTDLEPMTLQSMRLDDSTGYGLVLKVDSIVYQRGQLTHRVYGAEIYDMPSLRKVWDSQVFLRKEPNERDQIQVCSTWVAQARKDGVLR